MKWVEAREAAKYPMVHRLCPATLNDFVQIVIVLRVDTLVSLKEA
jgi:hypothetical protein